MRENQPNATNKLRCWVKFRRIVRENQPNAVKWNGTGRDGLAEP